MPQINIHIKGTDKVIRADENNVAAMLADLRQRYQPLKQFAQDSLGGVSPFSAPVDWKGTLDRYEHKEYASPFDGIPEAFAQGVYEAPGQLVALFDEFSPWAKVYNTIQGKTLQERVDEALGANELGYNPADYKGSQALQGAARLAGNIVGDPLNAVPVGMVGKAGAKQVASTIADEAGRTTMRNQIGAAGVKSQLGAVDLPMDEASRMARAIRETDIDITTGEPVSFNFTHNTDSATKYYGIPDKDSPFNRGYEPSGRYISVLSNPSKPDPTGQFVSGEITFKNPIVIDNNMGNWKKELSDKYGGKTGKKLSKAIIEDGYDGVITRDGKYLSEALDLTTFDESKAKYSKLLPIPAGLLGLTTLDPDN